MIWEYFRNPDIIMENWFCKLLYVMGYRNIDYVTPFAAQRDFDYQSLTKLPFGFNFQ